jgi:uncharacterized membrane protein
MDTFDFLSVLFSVVIGLALTEVLQGFRALVNARKRVIIFWPAIAWGVLMILIVAQAWWGMFAMHNMAHWNFLQYAMIVLQVTMMYLAAGTVMPELPHEGPVDMRAAYFSNHSWFFGLLALTVVATFLKDFIIGGRIESWPNLAMLLYYFALSAIAAVTRKPWFHYALAPATAGGVFLNAALLSFRL